MSKVVKGPASHPQSATPGGSLEEVLGGLLGGAGLGGGGGAAGTQGGGGGLLGGMLGSILGGSSAGRTAGSTSGPLGGGLGALLPALLPVLTGMLGRQGPAGTSGAHQLVASMQANGLGDVAASWVGQGTNQPISPSQVSQALSPEQLSELASKTGLSPDQVNQGVAAVLPGLVSHLTPDGTLPESSQVAGATGQLGGLLEQLLGGH